jgi:hypothetical protein
LRVSRPSFRVRDNVLLLWMLLALSSTILLSVPVLGNDLRLSHGRLRWLILRPSFRLRILVPRNVSLNVPLSEHVHDAQPTDGLRCDTTTSPRRTPRRQLPNDLPVNQQHPPLFFLSPSKSSGSHNQEHDNLRM